MQTGQASRYKECFSTRVRWQRQANNMMQTHILSELVPSLLGIAGKAALKSKFISDRLNNASRTTYKGDCPSSPTKDGNCVTHEIV
jgi:hypothetical protein